MSKRKLDAVELELLLSRLDDNSKAVLDRLIETLPSSSPDGVLSLFDSLRQHYSDPSPHRQIVSTRQAGSFQSAHEAAEALGIDFKDQDPAYLLTLKDEHLGRPAALSEAYATVIDDLKNNDYLTRRRDESFSRTVLDLLLVDRLRHLKDEESSKRLRMSAEAPMSARMTNGRDEIELIKGKADWVFAHGGEKSVTENVLLVVEAKAVGGTYIGLPQLIVYLAAVHEARTSRDKTNKGCWGMVSDSKNFQFAYLDNNAKLCCSETFSWLPHQSKIIAHIDQILSDAIESSPNTTPTRKGNAAITAYRKHLSHQWALGNAQDDSSVEDEHEVLVDIVNHHGRVVMRPSSHQ